MPRVLELELACQVCGGTRSVPECHGSVMEYDGALLFCPTCARERKVPQCCGQRLTVRRRVRDIRKEIFTHRP